MNFLEIKTSSEMTIEHFKGNDKLIINMDITFHEFPCSILSIDVQDIMGSHSVNIHGSITKNRINKHGKVIGQEVYKNAKLEDHNHSDHNHDEDEVPELSQVQKELDESEGCQVFGFLYVNKVPGNFHISGHGFANIIQQLVSLGYRKYNLSHTINHLSFGDKVDVSIIKSYFKDGQFNILDSTFKKNHLMMLYEYHLNIVPTSYSTIKGKDYYVYQYTSSFNNLLTGNLPVVHFRFDLSPITVRYWEYKEDLSHFLVQLCAIIGGIFAVTGIFDSIIHKTVLFFLLSSNTLEN